MTHWHHYILGAQTKYSSLVVIRTQMAMHKQNGVIKEPVQNDFS